MPNLPVMKLEDLRISGPVHWQSLVFRSSFEVKRVHPPGETLFIRPPLDTVGSHEMSKSFETDLGIQRRADISTMPTLQAQFMQSTKMPQASVIYVHVLDTNGSENKASKNSFYYRSTF